MFKWYPITPGYLGVSIVGGVARRRRLIAAFYFCMGMQRGRRPKIRFNNAAGFAHVLGFKMTAKTLDCTGKPRFGVGRLFSARYGRLSG